MTRPPSQSTNVAETLRPLIEQVLGGSIPLPMTFWDGSELAHAEVGAAVRIDSANALRQALYAPGALGIGRAYVTKDLEIEGDIFIALRLLQAQRPRVDRLTTKTVTDLLRRLPSLGVIGKPLPIPPEEARRRGRFRHVRESDREAISHHYDIPTSFYELFLGASMAYTSARYPTPHADLDEAQFSKYDLIGRKLGLTKVSRLLDVGCGWGGLCIYVAKTFGSRCVGITISEEQADAARKAVTAAGVDDLVEIRVCDFRDLSDAEPFDAVSAIGVLEHVGAKNSVAFFSTARRHLVDGGRMLTQAITKVGGAPINAFGDRYVFPDGELQDLSTILASMQQAGLEVRDVEGLREHYARTCEAWVRNLETNWDQAVAIVGENRARVWRLYMAASSVYFERNTCAVFQTLSVNTPATGLSGMPLTRATYV